MDVLSDGPNHYNMIIHNGIHVKEEIQYGLPNDEKKVTGEKEVA
jgi:hypothetical protein